jgi:uncharacterized protein with PIN domain
MNKLSEKKLQQEPPKVRCIKCKQWVNRDEAHPVAATYDDNKRFLGTSFMCPKCKGYKRL